MDRLDKLRERLAPYTTEEDNSLTPLDCALTMLERIADDRETIDRSFIKSGECKAAKLEKEWREWGKQNRNRLRKILRIPPGEGSS